MSFNVELPTDSVTAIIPVTAGCDVSFVLNQLAGNSDEQVPVNFDPGDSGYLNIDINRSTTLQVVATLDGNTTSFFIPSAIADQIRTQWSTDPVVGPIPHAQAGFWHPPA